MRALLPLTAGFVLAAGCACCSGIVEQLQAVLNEAGIELPAELASEGGDDVEAAPAAEAVASGDPCDAYADCICSLGKAMSGKMPTDGYDQACESIEQIKKAPSHEETCTQLLDAMKDSFGPQKDTFKTMGIDLPEACL